MNKQTLQNIASHTAQVSNSEIEEIKQLIGTYPFYSLPHVVLAKIYFEKEHYLFENALNQAAMRENDREWLYHYIHGDETFEKEAIDASFSDKIAEEIEQLTDSSIADEPIVEEDKLEEEAIEGVIAKNDLKDFLSDLSISEPIDDTEVEAIEQIEDESPTIIEETPEMSETPIEEIELPIQKLEISDEIETEQVIEPSPETINETIEEETISEIKGFEESNDIVETSDSEFHPDMDLRKHPVYNVESFLKEEEAAKLIKNEAEDDGEKDFFYWLNHPKPEVEEVEELIEQGEDEDFTEDHTLSIIEQFIKANPSISRPKKEFYSAENMAKRSENVDFEYVTETLANIYYEQGNIDLAIKAYEKLSLQNPLKQAYFASLIEKIKKEKR